MKISILGSISAENEDKRSTKITQTKEQIIYYYTKMLAKQQSFDTKLSPARKMLFFTKKRTIYKYFETTD
jgi:hypothetical protein